MSQISVFAIRIDTNECACAKTELFYRMGDANSNADANVPKVHVRFLTIALLRMTNFVHVSISLCGAWPLMSLCALSVSDVVLMCCA